MSRIKDQAAQGGVLTDERINELALRCGVESREIPDEYVLNFARAVEHVVHAYSAQGGEVHAGRITLPGYTLQIGIAADRYHASFKNAPPLPDGWLWNDLWDAMIAGASPAPSAAPAQQSKGIYVASRASVPARPQMWCSLRAKGWPIVSTWIDEAGEGETGDFTDLWQRIHDEIAASRGVILYAEESDFPLKGAFIECGMALGMGKPVAVVLKFPLMDRSMRPLGSWGNHPLVKICQSLDQARRYVESAGTAPEQVAQGNSSIDGQLTEAPLPVKVAQGEPVRYELRIRAPNGHCGPWYEVVDMTFKRFTANPDIGDGFTYEARALGILAAPVAPSHQNGDKA